ncbi:hypothetical protein C9975_11900, partial [Thalassospira xiamenensis]
MQGSSRFFSQGLPDLRLDRALTKRMGRAQAVQLRLGARKLDELVTTPLEALRVWLRRAATRIVIPLNQGVNEDSAAADIT